MNTTEGQAKIKEALTAMRKHFGENDRTQYEHRMFSLADEALSLLNASPPIVGEPNEAIFSGWIDGGQERGTPTVVVKLRRQDAAEVAIPVDIYRTKPSAQAPQSSPAPSVIEAGDAMENMMRRLRTQRDDEGILPTGNDFNGMDGLCAAWVAAKASRPSVTAPQGVTVDQIKGVISEVDDMHPYKVAGNADSYSSYNEGWSDACGIIEGRLSALLTK